MNVELWAYVIMPEHVHLLLCPQKPDYRMSKIRASLKHSVACSAREYLERVEDERWLNRLTVEYPSRRVFRFWQPGGGFDRNVFEENSVPAIIDYIHANPVRRGLVESPLDWPWSSARFWEGYSSQPLHMDTPIT